MKMDNSEFFLCIGAQKGGSTWLHECLVRHASVKVPPIKELHFFDEIEDKRGKVVDRLFADNWFDNRWRYNVKLALLNIFLFKEVKLGIWLLKYLFVKRCLKDTVKYKKLLSELRGDAKIVGEITPDYCILTKKTIRRMHEVFPKLKIIFILRNPVEREWSEAKMKLLRMRGKKVGEVGEREFLNFLEGENLRSEYIKTIENYLTYFPKKQLFIGFYDELRDEPLKFMNKILNFLNVEAFTKMPINKIPNKGVSMEIPKNIEAKLIAKYAELIDNLAYMFMNEKINYPYTWKQRINLKEIINSLIDD
ncbi:sulfotransferase [Fulvivirgaceae bacterium BMA12]|uniref:Sulfotransferase n=1 Tax=Agaribacillus aureus TaxID=3051825 RepID=A0ABT8LDX3_9BACT|nr:sulfotransferase [Fulvivirgaceae bacterium BMA12]